MLGFSVIGCLKNPDSLDGTRVPKINSTTSVVPLENSPLQSKSQDTLEEKVVPNPIMKGISKTLFDCTTKALNLVGVQGGYCLTKPEAYSEFEDFILSMHYVNGHNLAPSLSQIEQELKGYIEKNFYSTFATQDISSSFQEKGLNISVDAKIKPGEIFFNYDVSLRFKTDGNPKDFPNEIVVATSFKTSPNISLPSKLYDMHKISNYILSLQDQEMIPISELTKRVEDADLYLNVSSAGEDATLVQINTQGKNRIRYGSLSSKEDTSGNVPNESFPSIYTFLMIDQKK